MHVILLDNGRVDMLAHGYGEALCCVRCGACLNVCPVYREIGGHAYGSTYSGPIGAVISGLLHNSVTDVKKLPYASTLCGACRDACPVKIDLPRLLLDLRSDVVEEGELAAAGEAGDAELCLDDEQPHAVRIRRQDGQRRLKPAGLVWRRQHQGHAGTVCGMDGYPQLPAVCEAQLPRPMAGAAGTAEEDQARRVRRSEARMSHA